jgi:hypothetical protein
MSEQENKDFRTQLNEELGYVSGLFMSQGDTRAGDIVMPTEELNEAADRIELYAFSAMEAERERYKRRERELVKKVEGMFLAWVPDDEEFMRNGTTERLDNEYNKALSDVIEVIQDQLINPSKLHEKDE